jgi:ATP-dependent Clp protease ATP-binding subunit ClpA
VQRSNVGNDPCIAIYISRRFWECQGYHGAAFNFLDNCNYIKCSQISDASIAHHHDPLDKFGVDFTKRASLRKLDPVIGRDNKIRRVIQILSRRTKNNPVLIGDPGVGECLFANPICKLELANWVLQA